METNVASREIDLAQVNWPFCLLELKSTLDSMDSGQLLEVTVSDPIVMSTMEQVLYSSPDRVLSTGEKGPLYVLTVLKG